MGSQSSKFGPESVVGSKREHTINVYSSTSKQNIETKVKMSIDDTNARENQLINTSFKWTYGGNNVFVTGTFTNWRDHVPLQKVGNEFNTILRLPKGVYYYKFIVDGEWKFSPDDLTAPDEHGNINNIIDTTTIEPMTTAMIGSSKEMEKQNLSPNKSARSDNPFTEAAPLLPPHLMEVYFLNEKDKRIKDLLTQSLSNMEIEGGNKQKNKEDPRREFVVNITELEPPTHVTLNHLSLFGPFNSNSKKYSVTSTTQRFKSKYANVQFYSSSK